MKNGFNIISREVLRETPDASSAKKHEHSYNLKIEVNIEWIIWNNFLIIYFYFYSAKQIIAAYCTCKCGRGYAKNPAAGSVYVNEEDPTFSNEELTTSISVG